jgi:hypothetical protein
MKYLINGSTGRFSPGDVVDEGDFQPGADLDRLVRLGVISAVGGSVSSAPVVEAPDLAQAPDLVEEVSELKGELAAVSAVIAGVSKK